MHSEKRNRPSEKKVLWDSGEMETRHKLRGLSGEKSVHHFTPRGRDVPSP